MKCFFCMDWNFWVGSVTTYNCNIGRQSNDASITWLDMKHPLWKPKAKSSNILDSYVGQ